MAIVPVLLSPGVTTQETQLLNETRWSLSQLIRWKNGLLEKRGGWIKFSGTAFIGKCRSLLGWRDLIGNLYLAAGTNKRLKLYTSSNHYDITPIRKTDDLPTPFSTASASPNISVNDVGNGSSAMDSVNIITATSIAGLILQGVYEINTITDPDNYLFAAAGNANALVAGGGATAVFTTSSSSVNVNVKLDGHGKIVDDTFIIGVSTTLGGITLNKGEYAVQSVADVNNFVILADGPASSGASLAENGGNVRLSYLIASGQQSAAPVEGFGLGGYGLGDYGFGEAGDTPEPPRVWHSAAWGEDLLAQPTDGTLYVWKPSLGLIGNPATVIATAPAAITSMFLAMPQRQLILLGAEDAGIQDLLLVKWSDVDDYTKYRDVGSPADPNSQAGYYRIPRGGKIVGGLQGPQQGMIWTDLALWIMIYIGAPFLYSFAEIASGCGLIGSQAAGIMRGIVMWMSLNGFFLYDGSSVQQAPCDVWDIVFANLNAAQLDKITCATNSLTNEFEWFIPGADGDGENDISVKYNIVDQSWDYSIGGVLRRTAWIDQSVWGSPIGADVNGFLYQHEIGDDADDAAMDCYAESGWLSLSNLTNAQATGKISVAQDFIFLERLIPDFILRGAGNVLITVKMKEFPADESADNPITTFGPYAVNSQTNYAIVRGRNRFASLRFESNSKGLFWRLGKVLAVISPAGRR